MEYRLGDIMTFYHLPKSEWLLAEIKEKHYIFIDIWSGERWVSFKRASVHILGPDTIHRDGTSVWKK
jgi:hypothetical protein